jgi:hypothetical protein
MSQVKQKEAPVGTSLLHKKDTTLRFKMQASDCERGLWSDEQWQGFFAELEELYVNLKARKQDSLKFSILIDGIWHIRGTLLDTGLFRAQEIIGNFEEGRYKIKDPDRLAAENGRY